MSTAPNVEWITARESWQSVGPERLWVAIEAGALVSTTDGRTRSDHPRVSAGDGYFESDDAGATWRSPTVGLEVGYLRSVAIDPEQPEVVVVSASSGPYSDA